MSGYEVGDATWAPPPPEPFTVTAARPPRPLRIAFTTNSPIGSPVDPICAQAVTDAAKLFESLGHTVEEATPAGWIAPELEPVFNVLYAAGIAATIRFGAFITGRAPAAELVEALSWAFYTHGTTLTAADHIAAQTRLQGQARQLVSFFSTYDALLTPALAQRPLPIGTINTAAPDGLAEFHKAAVFTPFTAVWNITGQPAISLPLFHGEDGLPLSIQVVAPPLGEGLLLSLAAQLEAAHPWADRRPARE
jgi:amidase